MPDGRIEKAVLQNLESGDSIAVPFNPSEYQLEKDVSWKEQEVAGLDAPRVEFTSGGRRKLSLQLLFDTTDSGADVRLESGRVERLALIDRACTPPRPPRLLFRWGGFEFRSVLATCGSKYTFFSETGVPLRAELRITLGEFIDDEASGEAGGSPGAGAAPSEITTEAEERIDQAAERLCGDAAAWPELAEANGLEDPLDLGSGTSLTAPRRE